MQLSEWNKKTAAWHAEKCGETGCRSRLESSTWSWLFDSMDHYQTIEQGDVKLALWLFTNGGANAAGAA